MRQIKSTFIRSINIEDTMYRLKFKSLDLHYYDEYKLKI